MHWGWTPEDTHPESLILYKTGRTNANDGGIDFIMRPLGRIFQVTETTDVRKYFLDIDKVQRFPITFVIKSQESPDELRARIEAQARAIYGVEKIVQRYMDSVEELINIPFLIEKLSLFSQEQNVEQIMQEIITQSKLEFNYLEN